MERSSEKRVLGRGLSALMSDSNLVTGPVASDRADQVVAIEKLVPNPLQPRKDFEPQALQELANSIRARGVIQPLIVRPTSQTDMFEIVAGERRWRAAQIAEMHQLPVLIRFFNDQEILEIAIIENIQRADLNPLEEAMGYKQLMETHGHTQEKVAEALSKSRSHIANLLRLLSLPDEVQSMVRAGTLSAGHARALITSPDAVSLAKTVVGKGLSVRETEKLARTVKTPHRRNGQALQRNQKDADTEALESDLSASLGMLVQINHEPGGDSGTLVIRYNSLDDLDELCAALSVMRRDIMAS